MKTNILLVHPLYGEETEQRIFQPGIEFPISLLYLSAYLDKKGIVNDVLDLRMEYNPDDALYGRIKAANPRVIGITSSTAAIENAAGVAAKIKAMNPGITTVLGGWHASALPDDTLNAYPQFDYIIHGEGEIALINLLKCIDRGVSPNANKGLAFRNNGGITVNPGEEMIVDLDSIPFPARDKVPITGYHPKPGTRNYLRLPSTGILVGRGCPYRCLFCYKGVWGNSLRFRTPESVLEEIEMCIDRYGIKDFRFYDDTITFPQWDLKSLCDGIIKRKLNISWNCWSRVNDVNEEKLRLMKEAGCYHIKFGIEFGTEKALKLARKGATLAQARQAIALTKKVGIECKGSFIFGIPGETVEDCLKTIEFAVDISPHFATFYGFDPIPGSPFYERIKSGEIDPANDMITRARTQDLANQAYRSFYFRPAFIAQRIKSLFFHPAREGSMLISGMLMLVSFWLRRGINYMKTIVGKK